MAKLLTRDEFREGVFKRDNHKCIFCESPAKDAHHILERRLWEDGGYYLENGASVCEYHHLQCEMTLISCEEIREKLNLKPLLPPHLYDEYSYDKWGNIILNDSRRVKGELFYDESVQKILKEGGVLNQFIKYIKYPRSNHVPWSQSVNKDDRVLKDVNHFVGKRVIVTTKMDGENTSMYNDYIHARSIDSNNHPSRNWVKNFWSGIRYDIPEGWRICGENLYAEHSIHYKDLDSYFMLFSIWNDKNECLSWDETVEWAELMNIKTVPLLYDGVFDEITIRKLWDESKRDEMEGYVIRLASSFKYAEFGRSLAKFVRKGHVQSCKHNWQTQPVIPNGLKATV
jgi:hypothetical protein